MSDDEVDVGMTMAMDMIEKLNEEHSETLERNIKLEKEIQDIKDIRDGITQNKCDFCEETKKSKYCEYEFRTSNGITIEKKHTDYITSIHKLKCCEECRKIYNGGASLFHSWIIPKHIEEEREIRNEMIEWEQKWKKIKSPFTYKLVKEYERIAQSYCDLGLDDGGGCLSVPFPCCFRELEEMMNYVYHTCIVGQ
jgi:predicted  nucleic acid-binding Zn-ribbon protein